MSIRGRSLLAAGLLMGLLVPPVSGQSLWTQWHNSLLPSGQGTQITIASGGVAHFVILLPASPSGPESKAASDLQRWLKELSGVNLSIVKEPGSLGGKSAISIGSTNLAGTVASDLLTQDYGRDGYGIRVAGGDLFLVGGTDRGPISAVYALLEEDLGCRWYTASHRVIPSMSNLTFTPKNRTFKPPFELRDPFIYESVDESWSLRNRTNAAYATVRPEWGGNLSYGGWASDGNPGLFSHTIIEQLLQPSIYAAAHPEWFYVNNDVWQVCPSSEGAKQQIITNLRNNFLIPSWSPRFEIASLSQGDWGGVCDCAACQQKIAETGSNMGPMLEMVNDIAEELANNPPAGYADLRFSAMAYLDTAAVPTNSLRPRDNVIVRTCNALTVCDSSGDCVQKGALTYPLTPMQNHEFGSLLADWTAAHDEVYIWDYNQNFNHFMAPMPNFGVTAQNILFAKNQGADSYMTQHSHGVRCVERAYMRSWVFAKLMWNPDWDVFELVQDFVWGYFGSAASAMANYNELLRTKGIEYSSYFNPSRGGAYFNMGHPFITAILQNDAHEYFRQAAAAAVTANDYDLLQRVEREWLPVMYASLQRGEGNRVMMTKFKNIAERENVTDLGWENKQKITLQSALAKWNTTYPQNNNPFGAFETPIDGSTVRSSIAVTGWALDDDGIASVKIYRRSGTQLTFIGDAVFVTGARPDVANTYIDYPDCEKAGWGYMMLTNFLPNNGNGTFIIRAVATDNTGKQTNLGEKTIIVDNANAVKPFGAIDTPAQGGVASGSSYVVWGWALTPKPNMIPIDGSTLSVWVDGVNIGQPTYNIYRSDIEELFPDYINAVPDPDTGVVGAVGYFYLDTTQYDDGVHTISWNVADNAGNKDGIGSRYFTIDNSTGSARVFARDAEWDGFPDSADNCPDVFNPGQHDADGDGQGDACEAVTDTDGDGIADDGDGSGVVGDNPCTGGNTSSCDDNCRTIPNSDQADSNGDGVGDACAGLAIPAEMTSPEPGSTLSGSSVTFQWDSGNNVTGYYLRVGTSVGSGSYFSGSTGSNQSQLVTGLPSNGSIVYVRLSSLIDGSYQHRDYTYNTLCELSPPAAAGFDRIGEMAGGVPRTRIWGNRGITNPGTPGGIVTVGRASDGGEGTGYTAFRWQNGAFVGLPRAGSGPYSSHSWAYGVSADGSVVYGYDYDAGAPVVWTNGGSGWANANTITLSSGSGWGAISAGGTVIVDYRDNVAYRYTSADGWATVGGVSSTVLSGMTAAFGCSADGSIVVGTDSLGAAIFNGPSGAGKVSLPGGGQAFAVSDDGTVVAGVSPTNVYGQNEPCKWEYAAGAWTKTILPLLPGMVPEPYRKTGAALAVSADGSRISGHFREYGDYYIPLVWEGNCVYELEDILNAGDAYLQSGWYLADLGAMSADGQAFGGSMSDQPYGSADDNRHAWVATLGSFADCNGNGVDDAVDIANGTSTDCNNNSVPDECENDSDGDGTIDDCDGCPGDPAKIAPGVCGCGFPDSDVDGNGIIDCLEGETTFQRIGEMVGGVPRTRIWGNRGVTNTRIAVGRGSDGGEGTGYTAFRWENGTFVGLPRAGGGPYSSHSWAYGISADGSVVYGYDIDAGAPVVWTDSGSGWSSASSVTLNGGSGWGSISADGQVIIETNTGVAYRHTTVNGWATAGGVVRNVLSGLTAAKGCSSDGSIVVGTSASGPAIFNGPSSSGTLTLPGSGEALAVSDDGTVVVGTSPTNVYGKNEPCKWVYSGGAWTRTILPLLPGMVPEPNKHTGAALAVSADGRRIAGHFREYGDYYIPLIWDSHGVRTLESLLNDAGVFLEAGWYLADLGAMSPDGKTFGGSMSNQPYGQADNNRHAWIATVGDAPDNCGHFSDSLESGDAWSFSFHGSFPASSEHRGTWGTANEHSGSYGLALSNQVYAKPTTDYIAAGPGTHTLSAWVRGEMDDSSYGGWIVRAYFYDSNHQALTPAWQNAASCTGSSGCLTTGWSQKSGTVEAPAGTAFITIRLLFYMADGWCAFDDVALDGQVLSVSQHGVDGGFETDTGWSFTTVSSFPGSSAYRSTWGTADQHSGSYGLALSNQAYAYPATDFIAAGPGNHTVSAWVRGEMDNSSYGGWIIRVRFFDSNKQALSPAWQDAASCAGSASCVTTAWTQKSGTVTAPTGTVFIRIYLYLYMANGWVAYDDVALDGVPLTVANHGVDGGFETDTGWSFSKFSSFPGTSVYRGTGGTADQHSGEYALALSNQAYAYPTTDHFCAHPGTYRVSAWLRGEMSNSSFRGWLIRARFYDSNKQQLGYQNVASCTSGSSTCLSTTWSEKSGTVAAPAGTAFLRVQLYFYMSSGWAAYDDLEVVRVD